MGGILVLAVLSPLSLPRNMRQALLIQPGASFASRSQRGIQSLQYGHDIIAVVVGAVAIVVVISIVVAIGTCIAASAAVGIVQRQNLIEKILGFLGKDAFVLGFMAFGACAEFGGVARFMCLALILALAAAAVAAAGVIFGVVVVAIVSAATVATVVVVATGLVVVGEVGLAPACGEVERHDEMRSEQWLAGMLLLRAVG